MSVKGFLGPGALSEHAHVAGDLAARPCSRWKRPGNARTASVLAEHRHVRRGAVEPHLAGLGRAPEPRPVPIAQPAGRHDDVEGLSRRRRRRRGRRAPRRPGSSGRITPCGSATTIACFTRRLRRRRRLVELREVVRDLEPGRLRAHEEVARSGASPGPGRGAPVGSTTKPSAVRSRREPASRRSGRTASCSPTPCGTRVIASCPTPTGSGSAGTATRRGTPSRSTFRHFEQWQSTIGEMRPSIS